MSVFKQFDEGLDDFSPLLTLFEPFLTLSGWRTLPGHTDQLRPPPLSATLSSDGTGRSSKIKDTGQG